MWGGRTPDALDRVARINMSLSLNHEGVIALVRDQPAFAASLLRDLLHVEVPHFIEARLTEATLNQLVPVEYYADAVVLFARALHVVCEHSTDDPLSELTTEFTDGALVVFSLVCDLANSAR